VSALPPDTDELEELDDELLDELLELEELLEHELEQEDTGGAEAPA